MNLEGNSKIRDYKKVKDKVAPVHAIKTYKGSGGTAPLVFNLGSRWRPIQSPVQWVPGLLPGSKAAGGVAFTTHSHLEPRIRKSRAGTGIYDLLQGDLCLIRWRWVFELALRQHYLRERTGGTPRIGVWMGPRAVLEKKKHLFCVPGFETRTVQSLVWSPHRQRYPLYSNPAL